MREEYDMIDVVINGTYTDEGRPMYTAHAIFTPEDRDGLNILTRINNVNLDLLPKFVAVCNEISRKSRKGKISRSNLESELKQKLGELHGE